MPVLDVLIGFTWRFALVLAPAAIAALAFDRALASRSRNRLVYAAIAAVGGLVAVRVLGDMASGHASDPLLILAALAAPFGWGLILWVVGTGVTGYHRCRRGPGAADRTAPRPAPLVLKEAVGMREAKAGTGGEQRAVAALASRPGPSGGEGRWRPETPLSFVPGTAIRA